MKAENGGLLVLVFLLVGGVLFTQSPRLPTSGSVENVAAHSEAAVDSGSPTPSDDLCGRDARRLLEEFLGYDAGADRASDVPGFPLAGSGDASSPVPGGQQPRPEPSLRLLWPLVIAEGSFAAAGPVTLNLGQALGTAAPPVARPRSPEQLNKRAGELGYREAEFLIATVPDPIDSHVGWQFDSQVSAIKRAIEASGHVPDRYALPWECARAAERGAADKTFRRRHAREPGVMLFRGREHFLVLFLIGETPTSGIHKAALREAFRFVAQWQGWEGPTRPAIRMIAPTFSGSVISLRTALLNWWNERGCPTSSAVCDFKIISGSATNKDNADLLRPQWDAAAEFRARVQYHATVVADDARIAVFKQYLQQSAPSARVAVLTEQGTSYGQRVQGAIRPPPPTPASRAAQRSRDGAPPAPTAPSAPRAAPVAAGQEPPWLTLPFPVHISRVRSAHARQEPAKPDRLEEVGDVRRPTLELSLSESEEPHDMLPAMAPSLTAPADELALANIFSTISREGIEYIGLVATDLRDTLFLAGQIRKYYPDVRLFTFESELLYTHPTSNAAMEGTLVLSTYPLFNANQLWTFPFLGHTERAQFPSDRAQGAYNAALALLNELPQHREAPAPLLEYALPLASATELSSRPSGPPVWLSVVGRGGLWPLRFWDSSGFPSAATVWPASVPRDGSRPKFLVQWGFAHAVFLFIMITSSVACAGYYAAAPFMPPAKKAPPANALRLFDVLRPRRCPRCRSSQDLYVIGGLLALTTAYAWFTGIFIIPLAWRDVADLSASYVSYTQWVILAVFILAALLMTLGVAGCRGWRAVADESNAVATDTGLDTRCAHRDGSPARLHRALIVLCLALGGAVPYWLAARSISQPRGESLVLYERVTNLASGVSPIATALFLAAGLCWWALTHLRRLRIIERVTVALPLSGVPALACAEVGILEDNVRRVVQGPLRSGSWGFLLAVMLVFWLLPWLFLGQRFLPTFEGWGVDVFLKRALLPLYGAAILLAFLQCLSLWYHLRRLLRRLADHPLAGAFGRLASQAGRFGGQLWARLPSVADLELAVTHWLLLTNHFRARQIGRQLQEKVKLPADATDWLAVSLAHAEEAKARLTADLRRVAERGGSADLSSCETQQYVARTARILGYVLAAVWEARPLEASLQRKPEDVSKLLEKHKSTVSLYTAWDPADDLSRWLKLGEEFVALQVAMFINQQLVQIRNLLTFVTAGMLLLLLALTSYPFEPRGLLQLYTFLVIVSVVVASVVILVQIDRDEVLSRIAGTTPNRLDSSIIWKVAMYAVLPLVGLLATLFPELSGLVSGTEHVLRIFR